MKTQEPPTIESRDIEQQAAYQTTQDAIEAAAEAWIADALDYSEYSEDDAEPHGTDC